MRKWSSFSEKWKLKTFLIEKGVTLVYKKCVNFWKDLFHKLMPQLKGEVAE